MDIEQGITGHELAEKRQVVPDTMRKAINRKFGLSMSDFLNDEQVSQLPMGRTKTKASPKKSTRKEKSVSSATAPNQSTQPTKPDAETQKVSWGTKLNWQAIRLWLVFGAATVASVYNVLRICFEMLDVFSAGAWTVVLSIAALVFVADGLKRWFDWGVVLALVAFEGVCNIVRIYGGLTGWEKSTPTPFLGTVCDIFHTGTYATATVIGAVAALLIGGVQYVAIFKLNR